MIVFLTLCYIGVLALLVRMKVITLTLWWKLSPLLWMLFLLVALFIPMQWGAPAGPLNVYQSVVEIVPNISGEVIEVPVKGLEPLKKGAVLFRIDPVPFQTAVDDLQARLAEAIQDVERLEASAEAAQATVEKTEADIELAQADERTASANVAARKAALQEERGKKEKAIAVVDDLGVQVEAAQREFDRVNSLVPAGAATVSELDRAKIQLTGLQNSLTTAEVDVRVADDTIARVQADVWAAEAEASSAGLRVKQLAETELPRVQAQAREAELLANSMIGNEHTMVASVRAQLEKAEFDLEQTTVTAPSDGYVVGVTLRPGQRVAAFPMRSWMSFVPTEGVVLAAGIPQYALRHVQSGQSAEVTLKLFPGKTFAATVDEIAYINEQGQLQPSGVVMPSPGVDQSAIPFGVRLKLEDGADVDITKLPGGAIGTASVYTPKASATHIIRKVMIRMEAWMNYIIPW